MSSKKDLLINEIDEIPDSLIDDVLDYVQFLKKKNLEKDIDITIASESALEKDWLLPIDDKAWENLGKFWIKK